MTTQTNTTVANILAGDIVTDGYVTAARSLVVESISTYPELPSLRVLNFQGGTCCTISADATVWSVTRPIKSR